MILANNFPLTRLGINWQLSQYHGWGVFGINLAKNVTALGLPPIKLLYKPQENLQNVPELAPSLNEWQENYIKYNHGSTQIHHSDLVLIHSLGNNFAQTNKLHWGKINVGFIFFEFTSFTPKGIAVTKKFDLMLAGSRWNANLLKEMGLNKVAYVMQGVDTSRFEKKVEKKYPDRFVIFSGGKLEYRKGQDIVLAAYKKFYSKHKDALLITSWNNPWPQITQDLRNSPYNFGVPEVKNNKIDIAKWCRQTGLPDDAFIHLDFINNNETIDWYAQADIGIFPNRAEGGTNLVAMETMASGVPCILSSNTGHLDIIGNNNCYELINQKKIGNENQITLTEGWGESDLDEIIEKLENAYSNRDKNEKIGQEGKKFINQFSWENQTKELINICSNIY